MIHLTEAVIVEGKYDKIKLSNFIDAEIITTDGFKIFKDKEKLHLLRKIANKRGIIILTDSDSAGFLIRGHLSGFLPENSIKNVFMPEIRGKEKRKKKASSEGLLGVEGISEQVILNALKKAGVIASKNITEKVTNADLYELGLIGGVNCSDKRKELLKSMDLPTAM